MLKWLRIPPRPPMTTGEYFASLPRIQTEHLLLRRLSMRDAEDFHEYARDPEVTRHLLWSTHRSMADTRRHLQFLLEQYHRSEPGSWAIVDRRSGKMIGTIGFMAYDATHLVAEVGYSLNRAWWNRGVTTEAMQAVLREAFESLGVNRVEAMHFPENPASGRVMEKCGTRHEGRLRGKIWHQGQARDVEMWGITRQDWQTAVRD